MSVRVPLALFLFAAAASAQISTFPYAEDFESGPGGYTTTGSLSTWEHGRPGGNFIPAAASGGNAWVTNLDGPYAEDEVSYLVSPTFDFSGLANDPFVRFSHIYQLDFIDESWFEMSLDGGPFAKVGAANDPASLNWYNDQFSNWWDGGSGAFGAWRKAQHLLTGAAGSAQVVLRWVLKSDGFTITEDGIGVDDVELYEAPFGSGQRARPGVAALTVNDCIEVVGLPPGFGQPGPYYTALSASSEAFDLAVEGGPNQAIVLLGGDLAVGLAQTVGGQLDVAFPTVYASGLQGGGLNQLFVTNANGDMTLSISVPLSMVGRVVTFQAGLFGGPEAFQLTNAVQVAFLP